VVQKYKHFNFLGELLEVNGRITWISRIDHVSFCLKSYETFRLYTTEFVFILCNVVHFHHTEPSNMHHIKIEGIEENRNINIKKCGMTKFRLIIGMYRPRFITCCIGS
jgi:hypothetical protein